MIHSFKNSERLRYRISNDIRELVFETKGSNDATREMLSNTIFATVFSAMITEVAFGSHEIGADWKSVLYLIFIFILFYVAIYFSYKAIRRKIHLFMEPRKIHSLDEGITHAIKTMKDFDNIACDSVLVAKDFKAQFEKLQCSGMNPNLQEYKDIKAFYLFEIMHYLGVASDKTKALVESSNLCIRTMNHAEGVDIFRAINILNIMNELDTFLDENLSKIDGYENQQDAINYQHKTIKEILELISAKITEIQKSTQQAALESKREL